VNQQPSQDTEQRKKFRRIMGGLAIVIVFISQSVLYNTPIDNNILVPFGLWMGLLGLVIYILSQLITPPERLLNHLSLRVSPTVGRISVSVFFALLTTYSMINFQKMERINYLPVLTMWCFSGLFYLSVFPLPDVSKSRIIPWVKANRNELKILLLITLLAGAIRFYQLGSIPRVINGDEGLIGMTAQSTTSGQLANPFAINANMGGLYLQILNVFISLFHASAFSIRLPSAIAGVLAIPAIYMFSRKVFGKRVALYAAGLIAISHTHINFSRTLTGYIQDTWLIPLELFLLLDGLENRRSWQTALSGMLVALHFSYYMTAVPVVVIISAYMLLCLIVYPRWFKTIIDQVAAFWGSLIILMLPSIYYYLNSPNEFLSRINLDGTFQSGWLAATMAQTGQNFFQVLVGRVIHVFLSLIYYPALDFYGSPTPMLSLITSSFFLVGLGFALVKIRNRPVLLLNTVFWGFILMIGILAIPPSADSYRMVVTLPFAMLLAAVGIDQILTLFGLEWQKSALRYSSVISILFLLLLVSNMGTYFGEFAGRCQYGGDLMSRFASYLGSYVGKVDKITPVYLLSDNIFFYGTHPSVDFLSQYHPVTNITDAVETHSFQKGDILIASPNRIGELETWIHMHPGGLAHYHYDCNKTILLDYQVP
jgi:4-amino-4-deoxy-L-arabinose transferase-like glycosyltransferase